MVDIPTTKPATDWKHIAIGAVSTVAAVAIPTLIGYLQNLPWSTIAPAYAMVIPGILQIVNEMVTTQFKKGS